MMGRSDFYRDERERSHQSRSRSPGHYQKRSRSRSPIHGRSSRDHRRRSPSPARRDQAPMVEDIVHGDVNNLDLDAQQRHLDQVMQERRERVEKWRVEQNRKQQQLANASGKAQPTDFIMASNSQPQAQAAMHPEDSKEKKWSLEDEFDDDDDNDYRKPTNDDMDLDDHELMLPTKKADEEEELALKPLLKTKLLKTKLTVGQVFGQQKPTLLKVGQKIVTKNAFADLNSSTAADDDQASPNGSESQSSQMKLKQTQRRLQLQKRQQQGLAAEKPKSEPEDDDGIDPLDAFMVSINDQLKKQRGSIIHKEEKVKGDKKVSVVIGVAKKKAGSVQQADSSKKGELLEQNQDALEYSSEGETDMDDIQAINSNLQVQKQQKKPLTISKEDITYLPFRKNFYIEVPELARMTPEEVDEYRKELEGITVKGKGCPKPIKSWAQAGVSKKILDLLKRFGYEKPTPIQAQAIPAIMSGRDLIGIAKTGSGKTLAFLIPMFRHILDQPPLEPGDGPIAFIMTPTRELATQIASECRKFARQIGLRVVAVYGGASISEQISDLKPGAEIVVCTPGRMIEMLQANNGRVTNIRRCTYIVLDEADRMFDLGFEPQVMRIIEGVRGDRQTVLFSATFPRIMEALARRILNKPIEISVGGRSIVCRDIEQHVVVIEEDDKFLKLLEILGRHLGGDSQKSAIVFVDKQENADFLLKELMHARYTCLVLHGGIDQTDRDSTISDFKANKVSVLVATSVAARGLDVKHCAVVVNYDCPNHYEDYVHRCGRTGRAGNKGSAWTLITPDQGRYAADIQKALELSGYPTNDELTKLFNEYKARQEAMGKVVKTGGASGFTGKGFKFDEKEAQQMNERRKFEKVALGLQDSDDEDPDEDLNKEIENMLAPKKLKHSNPTTATTTAANTKSENGAAASNSQLNAVLANLNKAAGASTTATSNAPSVTTSASTAINEKLEMARRNASRVAGNLTSKLPLSAAAASLSSQSSTEAFLRGELPTPMPMSSAATAKSMAEQIAERLHAKINYVRDDGTGNNSDDEANGDKSADKAAFQRFEIELVINNFPQQARWRVTSKEAIAQIAEYSEAGITVRGTYCPPGKRVSAESEERPLYLAIEGTSERSVELAKNEIVRLIKEELVKLQNSSAQASRSGRYKVV